ncbi:MAG: 3-deoxy-7-phosphoheptulonate synthase [Candidatus Cloacimonadota bacterium]|nr:MAG: 3-deoxy-7-phosphoheptulonate synthase [Candidatus Cloacimonadota bacterium]PIE78875.1 MAG: 3-deoxy-7-phosphoheptulonate synthase [Candidatus Delongbacteria bacterium]
MIVVLDSKYKEKSLERVKNRIGDAGFTCKVTEGAEKTIVVVVGDNVKIDKSLFSSIDGVMNIISVSDKKNLAHKKSLDDKTVIKLENGITIGDGSQTLIAGPCSIESERQMEETATFLSSLGIKVLRGGAFKPRSSPYSFQGLEEEGLKIMRKVANKFNMASVSEAIDEDSLKLTEKYCDIIQIGARNMSNFSLLKKAGKTKKPILLKRGMNATTDDLLSSAEYILFNGNRNVILCERGIRVSSGVKDQFVIDFNGVDELQSKTHLPVIIDPSHVAKFRDRVFRLALASYSYGSDGMIIEVHPDPQSALSDGAQSLDFELFGKLFPLLTKIGEIL